MRNFLYLCGLLCWMWLLWTLLNNHFPLFTPSHMPKAKITIKQILTANQNWWHFYHQYQTKLRSAIVMTILNCLVASTLFAVINTIAAPPLPAYIPNAFTTLVNLKPALRVAKKPRNYGSKSKTRFFLVHHGSISPSLCPQNFGISFGITVPCLIAWALSLRTVWKK